MTTPVLRPTFFSFLARGVASLTVAIGLLGGPVLAVMPPYYEALAAQERITAAAKGRLESTDVLKLAVVDAKRKSSTGNNCPTAEAWEVRGQVMQPLKGRKAAGEKLVLRYSRNVWACPGPVREELPALRSGETIEAYLLCERSICRPAAGALSFTAQAAFEEQTKRREDDVRRLGPKP